MTVLFFDEEILQDVRRELPKTDKLVVVVPDDDWTWELEPPQGADEVVSVPMFQIWDKYGRDDYDDEYVVITNGGMATQVLRLILTLAEKHIPFRAYEIKNGERRDRLGGGYIDSSSASYEVFGVTRNESELIPEKEDEEEEWESWGWE